MVMSFDKYMEKVDSILESALLEYELQTLTENSFTDMKDADLTQEKGLKKVGLVIVKGLSIAWNAICEMIKKLIAWIADKIVGPNVKINIAFSPELADKIVAACKDACLVLKNPGEGQSKELKATINEIAKDMGQYKDNGMERKVGNLQIRGKSYDAGVVKAKLKAMYGAADALRNELNAHEKDKYDHGTVKHFKELQTLTSKYLTALQNQLISAVKEAGAAKINSKGGTAEQKAAKIQANNANAEKRYNVMQNNESATTIARLGEILKESAIIYRNGRNAKADKYMSKLLTEAAFLIEEADGEDDCGIDHCCVDDSGDADGDIAYEDVEDTIENDPTEEEAPEYDPEVSGGGDDELEVADLSDEDIADVIDGTPEENKEAIAILTDGEGSAEVDAAMGESVIIDFGF